MTIDLLKNILDTFFGIGALLLILVSLLALVVLIKKPNSFSKVIDHVTQFAPVYGIIFVMLAFIGPLTYSEIIQYTPCKLCWFQRIAMFPQLVILAVALWYSDKNYWRYTLILSSIGLCFSLFHYGLQMGLPITTECATVGQAASCASLYVNTFDFVTMPLMAASVFVAQIVLSLYARRGSRGQASYDAN
jgi:disulfide bond formation protein DsbB